MSWIVGSRGGANTHLALVTDLMNAATGTGLASIVIAGGGTGYVAGDVGIIVTVNGGTANFTAKVRITAVGSGAVTGAVVAEGGSYTANPSSPAGHGAGTTGTGATFTLTMASNGWTLKRRSVQAASATVGAPGTGGTNGTQTVTVSGGIGVTTAAQFSVTVAGNQITAVLGLVTAGLYERPSALAPPALTSTEPVTGAGLVGATLNITWAYPTTQEQVMILQGTGGGSDAIIVGLRTYSATNGAATARNWSLHGFTAYNAGLTFDAQAGISPGDPSVATGTIGAFVPLHDNGASFAIDFWLSVTPNRIVGAFQLTSASTNFYASMYAGFVNRFGSPSEWPYPILISGCTTRVRALHDSTVITYISSIVELIGNGAVNGPAWYRRSDSTWQAIANSNVSAGGNADETSPTRSTNTSRVAYPIGEAAITGQTVDSDDSVTADPGAGGLRWVDLAPTDGVPGTAAKTLHPTPNTGGALRRLYPCTVVFAEPGPPIERDVFGELDGVFWVSASDVTTPLTSEDFIDVGTDRYRVFQSGNRALNYTFLALREK